MNLTETQIAVRKLLIAIAVMTFIYYSGRFLIIQGINAYNKIFPKEPAAPEARFGPLPKLKMTSISIPVKPQYVLDTVDGKLPVFQDRIAVYQIIQPQTTLLSEQKIKQLAKDMFFTGAYTKISASEFKWVDGSNSRTFQANAITRNFSLDTDSNKLSNVMAATGSITQKDAESKVLSFIKSKTLFNSTDLEHITTSSIAAEVLFGILEESGTAADSSKLIKINIYRYLEASPATKTKKAITYQILGPDPKNSLASFFTTNDSSYFKFPIIDFTYWDVDYEDKSNYYLSPIEQVWTAVTEGKGITAYLKTSRSDYFGSQENLDIVKVEIRDIYLAYYEPAEFVKYLQPIYVFEGQFETSNFEGQLPQQGEITIYYPAIRGDFVKSTTEN
ncbi:hypothetical protein A2982_01365 [candidate division WWE3 bacterium RIFCSPLOWO2_01_FULL_39_13]|uniref:Uncharacterized protein n=1 Tax=candidate division WWE3 bacterium RIFCSPLOWO2_01_FULL_39_13 TaxID=1802624 RepID=A0A1F4V4N6_UNCKA|nr:MAG: hypothetical protein A2982_01365 [candidate division WWE3 bacterium RIFCSPLOWO2_01_FULL_39_13]